MDREEIETLVRKEISDEKAIYWGDDIYIDLYRKIIEVDDEWQLTFYKTVKSFNPSGWSLGSDYDGENILFNTKKEAIEYASNVTISDCFENDFEDVQIVKEEIESDEEMVIFTMEYQDGYEYPDEKIVLQENRISLEEIEIEIEED